MECYCDFEPASVYQAEIHTARKRHRCSECGGHIEPGNRYERAFGVWEEGPDVFKTCPRCLRLRQYVEAHVPCVCWSHGNMREDALVAAREFASEGPGLLFGAYRLEVLIRRHRRAAV
jgi:hypothetical protein